jgi:hypothetical protein
MAERKLAWRAGGLAVAVPDNVEDYILKSGVAVVAVGAPTAGANVHFHVADARAFAADLYHRAAKIRAAFGAAESRMKDAHGLAVQSLELVALQALVLPDGLQQALGRRAAVVAEKGHRSATHAPLGVKMI